MNWRYTLGNNDNNGNVLSTLVINEPMNWKESVFTLKRDETYHGIYFDYNIGLKFVNDAGGFSYLQNDLLVSIWLAWQFHHPGHK